MSRPFAALAWAIATFGPGARDPRERAMRFLEEAIEVVHALELERELVDKIATRVYGRPRDSHIKEIGQAALTLELLAASLDVDANRECEAEWVRVVGLPREHWEKRHVAKAAIGITGDA